MFNRITEVPSCFLTGRQSRRIAGQMMSRFIVLLLCAGCTSPTPKPDVDQPALKPVHNGLQCPDGEVSDDDDVQEDTLRESVGESVIAFEDSSPLFKFAEGLQAGRKHQVRGDDDSVDFRYTRPDDTGLLFIHLQSDSNGLWEVTRLTTC